jgi:exodeoxyribonuclease VII small subunit
MKSSKAQQSSPTFEEALRRLEQIVQKLEQGEISLDESLKMYEEGIALSKGCMKRLMEAEVKLKKLGKDMEGHFQVYEENGEDE